MREMAKIGGPILGKTCQSLLTLSNSFDR